MASCLCFRPSVASVDCLMSTPPVPGPGLSPSSHRTPQIPLPPDFVPIGVERVAVRQIPANGQCGWLAMALVYLAMVSGAASINDAAEVLEELKRRMKEKLDRDPSDFEGVVCWSDVNTIAEYQHKILHESYQTEQLDLRLLSAVIGVSARVVSPEGGAVDTSPSETLPGGWCVLAWKGQSHYDLVYCLDSSTQRWSPLLTKEQAASVELEAALRSFMVRQHELDRARRAEEDCASLAAIEAMGLSEDVSSSGSAHRAALATSIPDERMGTAAAATSTVLPSSAAAASSQDRSSAQNSAAPAIPTGDALVSVPSTVASSSPGEAELHAAAHWGHQSAKATRVIADFVL